MMGNVPDRWLAGVPESKTGFHVLTQLWFSEQSQAACPVRICVSSPVRHGVPQNSRRDQAYGNAKHGT